MKKKKKNIHCGFARGPNSGEVYDVAGFGRGECGCTPKECIYFLICSPYDNLKNSLKMSSPNRTHELGHRFGESMTCMLVHWRMGGEGGTKGRLRNKEREMMAAPEELPC